jgi:hypothetical protein
MDALDAIHLVFGNGTAAPRWYAQALDACGAMDSRRINGIWVHAPARHADDLTGHLAATVTRGLAAHREHGSTVRILIPLLPESAADPAMRRAAAILAGADLAERYRAQAALTWSDDPPLVPEHPDSIDWGER